MIDVTLALYVSIALNLPAPQGRPMAILHRFGVYGIIASVLSWQRLDR